MKQGCGGTDDETPDRGVDASDHRQDGSPEVPVLMPLVRRALAVVRGLVGQNHREPAAAPVVLDEQTPSPEAGVEAGPPVTDLAQDHWDKMFDAPRAATWHSNSIVQVEINRRLGSDSHWLFWLFQQKLPVKPRRLLSIGCGDGAHELLIARHGLADYVEAFDLSGVGIANAQKTANAENLNARFYQSSFEDFINKPVGERFDAVIFIGSLHHVRDLEGMFSKVRDTLTDDGLLLYNEYVGPCYILFPEEQVAIINEVIAAIPVEYKHSPEVHWINPSIEVVLNGDPSESVRSALIRPFMRMYFNVSWEAGFGGALLHPLFQMLHGDRLEDGSPGSRAVVNMCIAVENLLMKSGTLQNDFCIGVATPRR